MAQATEPINELCRSCLKPTFKKYTLTGTLINLDFTIADMLEFCTSKKPDLSDDLPDSLCTFCYRTLRMAYEFFRQFYSSQNQLYCKKIQNVKSTLNYDSIRMPSCAEINTEVEEFMPGDESEQEYKIQSDSNPTETSNITIEFLQVNVNKDNTDLHNEESEEDIGCEISNVEPTVIIRNIENQDEKLFPYICPICPTKHSRIDPFYKHILEHNIVSIICPRCDAKPEYKIDEYIDHYKEFHKLQCEICSKTLASAFGYRYHMKQHINMSCYKCPIKDCSRSFVLKNLLRKHIKNHYQPPVYPCHLCSSTFNTRDSLRYHLKKHFNKKDHLCTICGRSFYLAGHLTHHMYGHTGHKRFGCNICEKKFTTSTCLKKHTISCAKKNNYSVTTLT